MDIWDSGNPWVILTVKVWWPVSVLRWFQNSECIQTGNSLWSWQALFLWREKKSNSSSVWDHRNTTYTTVIHYKAKTNIYICFFVHLTLDILLCWIFITKKKKKWSQIVFEFQLMAMSSVCMTEPVQQLDHYINAVLFPQASLMHFIFIAVTWVLMLNQLQCHCSMRQCKWDSWFHWWLQVFVHKMWFTCTFSCFCIDTEMYIIITASKTPAFDIWSTV